MANKFSVADYVVFAVILVVSAGIGVVSAVLNRKKQSTTDHLLGGRKLKIFPIAMSILASFTSAIAILGFSSEMYKYGTQYWMIGVSYFLTQPFAAHFYAPLFHGLNITSAYEYLELRFDRKVRIASSVVFCLKMILYMAVVLYAPSVAIEAVTGLPLWALIMGTGILCTFYTALGGMKAGIWIDSFQVLVMFAGLFTVIVKGSMQVGGLDEVWKRAYESDRIEFFDFNPNPFVRHSFWTLTFGGFLTSLTVYGANQGTIQRYLSVPTANDAIKSIYINLFGGFFLLSVTCMTGLVAFAVYYDCDILFTQKAANGEQILPFLVLDLLSSLPGLPGLFISCVYSAALSTVSAGLNSLSAVCIRDFIQPYSQRLRTDDRLSMISTKLIAVAFGILTIGLANLCKYLGSTVLQIAQSIFGMLGGPLLGVVSLGIFIPQVNSIGALSGLIVSAIINVWIGVGSSIVGLKVPQKPYSIDGCPAEDLIGKNLTQLNNFQESTNLGFKYIYKLSYLHYSGTAIFVSFTVAIIVSYFTGFNDVSKINEKYYVNLSKKFSCLFKKQSRITPESAKEQQKPQQTKEREIQMKVIQTPKENLISELIQDDNTLEKY